MNLIFIIVGQFLSPTNASWIQRSLDANAESNGEVLADLENGLILAPVQSLHLESAFEFKLNFTIRPSNGLVRGRDINCGQKISGADVSSAAWKRLMSSLK